MREAMMPNPHDDLLLAAAPAPPDVEVDVAVEEDEDTATRLDEPWRVILYNDDIHSFDEVILQLIKAIRCSAEEAARLALKAHFTGRAAVFEGTIEECLRVQGVLREIQLVTDIEG